MAEAIAHAFFNTPEHKYVLFGETRATPVTGCRALRAHESRLGVLLGGVGSAGGRLCVGQSVLDALF
jgi:hypothetical protein